MIICGTICAQFLTLPPLFHIIIFGTAGLIIGSFIAALSMRWPRGISVTKGRSCCDHCGQMLSSFELIPLLSYIIMRGKCRHCGGNIDPFHWKIEIISAYIAMMPFLFLPAQAAVGWALLGWILLPLFILDFRHFWLPNALLITLIIAALIIAPLINDISIFNRLFGAAAGYLSLALVALYFRIFRKKEALGAGDPKLLAILGFYFGWQALPFIMFGASFIGLSWALILMILGHKITQDIKFPLGSYMILALPLAIAAENFLIL